MPPTTPPTGSASMLPLPPSGPGSAEYWTGQLEWATEIRRNLLTTVWRPNAQAYRNKLKPPKPDGIRVNIEYEKTEQKKYQLFYRLPAIKLKPSARTLRDSQPAAPLPGQPPPPPPRDLRRAVSIFKEVVTRIIGPRGANCAVMMGEVLFDVLCPAGIGFAKVGYERFTDGQVQVPTGAKIPDPNFQQPGAILGVSLPAPMIDEMAPAPNVVAEQYYASRISPALAIIPPEFRGSDYARNADYLGHDFPILTSAAQALGWNVDSRTPNSDTTSPTTFDEDRIVPLDRKGTTREGQVWCRELFYYASRLDPTVKNPYRIRRLVFVHGQKAPVVHENYNGQKFDARGRLIAGVKALPIKVLTLRYVSDSAHPPSDCEITRQAADELAEFRTGQVIHRRKAIPRVAFDVSRIANQEIKDKVIKGDHYDDVPVDGNPQNFAAEIGRPSYPSENWRANDAVVDDINRAWALGSNQSSTTERSGTTATEIAAISQATANRLGGEREICVSGFLMSIIEDLATLFQLFADREDYVEILGVDGEKSVEAFTKDDVQGEFLFDAVPDSSMAPDASADRDLLLNLYNLVRNDPNFDHVDLDKQVAEAYGQDADRLVKPPPPAPPPSPPAPTVGISFKGDDLNPMAPQYPNVLAVLKLAGIDGTSLSAAPPPEEPITPANVVDRERLRMAISDEQDKRSPGVGGLSGAIQ